MEYIRTINGLPVSAEYADRSVENIFLPLLRAFTELYREKGRRITVFLAAPPAAGKSTLVSFLEYLSLNNDDLELVTPIGMDGFHHYQDYLVSHTVTRDGETFPMVKIKGAPVSFDLELLQQRLALVAAGEECFWPEYSRTIHNPVDGVNRVKGNIVLLEGNYLLLDESGWRDLRRYSDFSIFIKADEADLKQRLADRKSASGMPYEDAVKHVEFSDLRNVREVLAMSSGSDLTLKMLSDGSYIYESGKFPSVK